jgi:hypothetical protein
MDSIKISIPFTEILTNQNIQNLAMSSLMLGAVVEETENGFTTYTKIKNNDTTYNVLTFNTCAYILSLGGEIKNYQVYIEINPNDLVPNGIRNNKITNEEGIETQLTWSEWIHPSNTYTTFSGKNYISSYSHYAGFKSSEKPEKCLFFSEVLILINAGYNVLNKLQYLNLIGNE